VISTAVVSAGTQSTCKNLQHLNWKTPVQSQLANKWGPCQSTSWRCGIWQHS